ncbi:hypothetical protein CR513_60254, partial [Mucuna pruriens]
MVLPKFHGLTGEDPNKYLKEFLVLFPASKTTSINKKIYDIRQYFGETLYEYWKRFNKFQRLENKIIELTSLVRQLATRQHHTIVNPKGNVSVIALRSDKELAQ